MGSLQRYRNAQKLSAAKLAGAAGVTRQTIHAMEAGTFMPNTALALRLGKLLGTTVEELFGEPEAEPQTGEAHLLAPVMPGQPVRLARVNGTLVGLPAAPIGWPEAEGIAEGTKRTVAMVEEGGWENRVLFAGCDPAIAILAQHLAAHSEVTLIPANCSSTRALEWLQAKRVHVAGTHLDPLPARRKGARVVTFACWEEGLLTVPGTDVGIADLVRQDISIVNREPGAGSRILLDRELSKAGIPPSKVRGYGRLAAGHLEAAWFVRAGLASACIAPLAAARAFGLHFTPLASERYDLVIPQATASLPAVQIALDALASGAVRRKLRALAGYDTSLSGREGAN